MIELDYKLPKDTKYLTEWAEFYKLKVNTKNTKKITVYEFAYLIGSGKVDYICLSFMDPVYKELSAEEAEENELMLMEVYNAIMGNADDFELEYLKDRYIETAWVKLQIGRYN
jgi:hypothetical protein